MEKDLHIPQQTSNPRTPWDMLSLSDKSDMIRIAIDNGVLNLTDIRDKYNEFAKGGYVPSKEVKGKITNWEGAAMTGAKDPLSGKYLKNDSFEAEAERFTKALPESIREQVLSNPELADSLYSYSYNVGAGNFKKRVVPALENYYSGKGSAHDIVHSMWASGDKKLKGLKRRRDVEKAGVINALASGISSISSIPSDNPFVYNPYINQALNTPVAPIMVPDEDTYITTHQPTETELRKQKLQEHMEAVENFNQLMQFVGIQNNPIPSFLDNPLSIFGPTYASGGSIHIKPENRGKFTALKERTGHSASWFKEHGTPAQKKMATFALNARHWKHGLGGNLFEGGGETSAFEPLKHPKIPVTPEDQEATNWIANWYNQRREQLYNNAKDYNSFLVMNDDAKDRRFGLPIGKSAADRAYYEKLRNMAQYKTASFEDLKEEEPDNYAAMRDEDVAYTSQNGTIYYNDPAMMFIELQKPNNPGFSLMGTHIHERTHSSGNPGKNNNLIGYNAQTAALKNIIKLKKGLVEGELDTYPEIYGRMMEFRYNHNMNPRKKYTSKEIQKMLDQEDKIINSALQRYDLESLTKALNDVAQGNVQSGDTFLPIYL